MAYSLLWLTLLNLVPGKEHEANSLGPTLLWDWGWLSTKVTCITSVSRPLNTHFWGCACHYSSPTHQILNTKVACVTSLVPPTHPHMLKISNWQASNPTQYLEAWFPITCSWAPQQLLYRPSKISCHFVLFQGCSWMSIDYVTSWMLHYNYVHTLFCDNGHYKPRWNAMLFPVCLKSVKRHLPKRSHTAPPLVAWVAMLS